MDNNEDVVYNTLQIQEFIPHRHPFLMVDKIVEFVDNLRIVGLKSITANEPFLAGHFPGRPVMPSVLILEAMAQTAGILARASTGHQGVSSFSLLVGVDVVEWLRQVMPGETLRVEMTCERVRRPIWRMKGAVTVNGELVASSTLRAYEVMNQADLAGM